MNVYYDPGSYGNVHMRVSGFIIWFLGFGFGQPSRCGNPPGKDRRIRFGGKFNLGYTA